jgi:hypothetical protein
MVMALGNRFSSGKVKCSLLMLAIAALGALELGVRATGAAEQASGTDGKPQITHAKVEERDSTRGVAQEVDAWAASAEKAQWLGYAVPAVSGERRICCGNNGGDWNGGHGCGPCELESGNRSNSYSTQDDNNISGGQVKLEGPNRVVVLFRAEGRKIGKIRVVSEECVLDAGGLPLIWLKGVNGADSIKLLERFVNGKEFQEDGSERTSSSALMAIAMHGDAAADQAFAKFIAPEQPESLRREAAFWAGEARGASGLQLLKRMAKDDASSDVRTQVTFALSISHEKGAVDEMIRMAHEDASGHVRGQALFWLAQKAGKKASSAISGAIENDPDTEVKKKAVFALSQMPKEDGVPKLIQVAETNRNPEVRKQAMFWLGQSNDPRALEFFEKVLGK